MLSNTLLHESNLAQAWAQLHNQVHNGSPLQPDSNRLAFADPEFLFRRATRGIRFQLEMLKPDIAQTEQGIEQTIVVYGSARFVSHDEAQAQWQEAQASGDSARMASAQRAVANAVHYENARTFGRLVAQYSQAQSPNGRVYVCTGGGPGIMEAANRGASEVGEPTIGLNIVLPHEQHGNPYITPSLNFKFHYFALRKMHFMMRALALVAFPGGFGTLDELFEVLTLVQTKKTKAVPIVLVGSAFWRRLIDFDMLVDEGTISPEDVDFFHITDCPQEAWDHIQRFYAAAGAAPGAAPAPASAPVLKP